MFLMLPGSFALLEIGLLIFCLIDVIQTPGEDIRGLAKGWWVVLVIVLPFVGGIAWLVAGRPNRAANPNGWRMGAGFPEHERTRRPAPKGPDDDPDFLRQIQNVNSEQEQTLKLWEEDLRRREAEQRRRDADPEA